MRLLVIVPLYNEIELMERNIPVLRSYLSEHSSIPFEVVVSAYRFSDEVERAGKRLEAGGGARFFSTATRGRGAGLIEAQKAFAREGDWVGYIDLDLPVALEKFREAEAMMESGKYDVIAASRYGKGASINGPLRRKVLSRGYIMLANIILFGWFRVRDFQAGFKFWRKEAMDEIIEASGGLDARWFFDTELLYYSRKLGKRLGFIPVDYDLEADKGATTVSYGADIAAFVRNLLRLRFGHSEGKGR